MNGAPNPRRPIKVVAMVVVYWVGGNILQSALGSLLVSGGLLDSDNAFRVSLVLGWGLLFLVSFVYREQLDRWLRT
jgi:hypothetical protein